VTKPAKIGLGIGAAAVVCAGLAAVATGIARWFFVWTSASCVVASLAYALNRPHWLGKRSGAMGPRAWLILPYIAAFGIAVRLMRWWRGADRPTRVAPGVWVGGRTEASTLPPGVTTVVDLVAEYPAPRAVRALPGYRNLLVLDGGVPPDPDAFLALVREVADAEGEVLVHCDSGRGRAPTFAAALLVVRGLAPDVERALAMLRAARAVVAPTRVDRAFLALVEPRLCAAVRTEVVVDLESPVG
jgi:protein-tyrosine phosphatase